MRDEEGRRQECSRRAARAGGVRSAPILSPLFPCLRMPPRPARPLFLLDYDGTLAPIVDDPARAHPHPEVWSTLSALSAAHPVVVISGRDMATLARFLPGLDVRAVGLHGAEEGRLGEAPARPSLDAHAEALAGLRAAVPQLDGVVIEDKGGAFAVHYRHAADEAAALGALRAWAAGVPAGLTAIWGKKVVELRPEGVSKGVAVARLAAEHPDRAPVYIGDDTTDEDAFVALAEHADAMTVKVGGGGTAAAHRLPDVDAVVAYLRAYLT